MSGVSRTNRAIANSFRSSASSLRAFVGTFSSGTRQLQAEYRQRVIGSQFCCGTGVFGPVAVVVVFDRRPQEKVPVVIYVEDGRFDRVPLGAPELHSQL